MPAAEYQILQGDVLARLADIPDGSVHCVVTSPPYWGLRDYGVAGQFGLEKTPEEYVARLVAICREIRRVLRDDGVFWLNLGDCYATTPPGNKEGGVSGSSTLHGANGPSGIYRETLKQSVGQKRNTVVGDLKPGDLVGIPWRCFLALQADGWYGRCDVIWSKPNPMPESVSGWRWMKHRIKTKAASRRTHFSTPGETHQGSDFERAEYADCPGCEKCSPNDGLVLRRGSWRPTKSHEYVFMLTKTGDYFADGDAAAEPAKHAGRIVKYDGTQKNSGHENPRYPGSTPRDILVKPTRNRRSVWEITTKPYKGAHFATFPPDLVEPCLLSSTSEKGCCPSCGAPWARIVEKERIPRLAEYDGKHQATDPQAGQRRMIGAVAAGRAAGLPHDNPVAPTVTTGWRQTCSCPAHEPAPCIVLDPFAGSGTTLAVALKHGRHALGIELNPAYIALAEERIAKAGVPAGTEAA